MSKTQVVIFRGQSFAALDVVAGVFLKYLIDAASPRAELPGGAWLTGAIDQWRFNAVISDCGIYLDDAWSDAQVRTFLELSNEACVELAKRDSITADEIESWPLLENEWIFARRLSSVSTRCVIRFGQALMQIVRGAPLEAPPGHYWYFSIDDDPLLMQSRG